MKTLVAGLAAFVAFGAACSDHSTAPAGPPASYSVAGLSAAGRGGDRQGFGFNGIVSGFPTGRVFLTGGGSFDAATASNIVPTETDVKSGGGFGCLDAVAQGPLAGCETDQGVRWDTAQLLASTTFKCTGADAGKPAVTGPGIVVLLADFYRAGDGIDESFTAQMIAADHDIAPEIDGVQNLWIQGVGCGNAIVNFNR
jgi:hypothetical protein